MEKQKRLTFCVRFFLKYDAHRTEGRSPLLLRVTIDGLHRQTSIGLSIAPHQWRQKAQRAVGTGAAALNDALTAWRRRAEEVFCRLLFLVERRPTADEVIDRMLGRKRSTGLVAYFRRHNAAFAARVPAERAHSSLNKYHLCLRHLCSFLQARRHTAELPIADADATLLTAFADYLHGSKGFLTGTVRLYLSALCHVLLCAAREGLPIRPLRLPETIPRRGRTLLSTLDISGVRRLLALPLANSMARVRDAFVLACFTGLSYADMATLHPDHLQRDTNGRTWIIQPRRKTGQPSVIPLTQEAQTLIRHLQHPAHRQAPPPPADSPLLPRLPDLRTCNRLLQRLERAATTGCHLHFHLARHTFATMALTAGIPIESVSRMLGHAHTRTTEMYARVTIHKLSGDARRLEELFVGGK